VSVPVGGFDAAAAYARACSSCHGLDGRGVSLIPNSDLTGNGILGNDSLIFVYLTTVQPFGSYPHPYRGGYPELNDSEIFAVIDYLQTLPVANP
jgi:mono/diheme cytochrome c family protein